MTYTAAAGDIPCEQGPALLRWEAVDRALHYDVRVNGDLYATTSETTLPIGAQPLDQPDGLSTFRLLTNPQPYTFQVTARNAISIREGPEGCFIIAEDQCEPPEFGLPHPDREYAVDETIHVGVTASDSTAIEFAELMIEDETRNVFQQGWQNQRAIAVEAFLAPPEGGWVPPTVTLSARITDVFGNQCETARQVPISDVPCQDRVVTQAPPTNTLFEATPITLSWSEIEEDGPIRLRLDRLGDEDPAVSIELPEGTTEHTLDDVDLPEAGTYRWWLESDATRCVAQWFEPLMFTVAGCSAAVFIDHYCNQQLCGGGGPVTDTLLSWNFVDGALAYQVDVRPLGEDTFQPWDAPLPPTINGLFMSDADPNFIGSCEVRVRACMEESEDGTCICWAISDIYGAACRDASCDQLVVEEPFCSCNPLLGCGGNGCDVESC